MIQAIRTTGICCLVLFCAACLGGCTSGPTEEDTPAEIIQTPVVSMDADEFSEELALKRAAYPYDIDRDPDAYNEMVVHLIEVLSEELVLLSAASESGITVTDAEVEAAEKEFRKDYPEDSFEQMLLRNAIPYALWKKRFRRDMIIGKLVDRELAANIEISPEEIVQFYQQIQSSRQDPPEQEEAREHGSEAALVTRLRMHKMQEQYDHWIQGLWEKYPVALNKENLKSFLIALEQPKGKKNEE